MPALSLPRLWAMLLSGASVACGFAALGVALYAGTPRMAAAAWIFAVVGLVTGVVCALLSEWFQRLPASARLAAGQPGTSGRSTLSLLAQMTWASQRPATDAPPAQASPASPGAPAAPLNTGFADTVFADTRPVAATTARHARRSAVIKPDRPWMQRSASPPGAPAEPTHEPSASSDAPSDSRLHA